MVLGIRGMPDVQGGVETHAQELYPRLAALGCEVEVLVRSPFAARGVESFGRIKLRRLWAPRRAGLEAVVHSLLGVIHAVRARPDVLHIHSIGPAIVTPIARLFGLKVVVTIHSQNYEHEKWGAFARWLLRSGERLGAEQAHALITVSKSLARLIESKYRRASTVIPNGVVPADFRPESDYVVALGLQPGRYFLHVGRISEEKRQLDLIRAYTSVAPTDWKLALTGMVGSDHYSRQVLQAAKAAGVVLTGYLKGIPLAQLYTHAGGFVLPSAHEGLPIALLEALSYGLRVVVSDISANLELDLDPRCYFPMGDVTALAAALESMARSTQSAELRQATIGRVVGGYNWDDVAARTLNVYRTLLRGASATP